MGMGTQFCSVMGAASAVLCCAVEFLDLEWWVQGTGVPIADTIKIGIYSPSRFFSFIFYFFKWSF